MCTSNPAISSTATLRRAGVNRAGLERRLATGHLTRVRRGIYATADACVPLRDAAGHGGAPTCVTAARHLGLWVLSDDQRAHVWRRDGERRHHGGCDCVEHWGEDAACPPDRFPPPVRILRHLFACEGVEVFFVALESALRLRIIDSRGLRALRRRSNAGMREALALARTDADSGLESLLRWRLRAHGLKIRTQVRILGVGQVDALIGDRIIVETDGRVNHDGPSQRHKDLVRDAAAASWGYTTFRFGYELILHDWDLVERAILGALAERSP